MRQMIFRTTRVSFLWVLALTLTSIAQTSINEMPSNLRESIEWVWNNRIVPRSATAPIGEGSTERQNLIFDQIYDAGGHLNYVVRWQSSLPLTRTQRQGLQTMIQRQINNWTRYLVGFEGWPYGTIPVNIVGWAVDNAALIQDPQPGEVIYTTYSQDAVHNEDASIPANLPYAPATCSRFEHFNDNNYTYSSCPQGPQGRFDMYLWATANWRGGVGGDWGQRMAETYYLNNINTDQITILEHEIGHGFGITDFYGTTERPPNGFPTTLIMWAGNSPSITQWDAWMLRYIWWKLKANTTRFPPRTPSSSSSVQVSSATPSSSSVTPSSSTISSSSAVSSSSQAPICTQTIIPYMRVNSTAWQQVSQITVHAGDTVVIGPQPVTTSGWSWSGPNGYSANLRQIRFDGIQVSQQGTYRANFASASCNLSQTFNITVEQATIALHKETMNGHRIQIRNGILEIHGSGYAAEILDLKGRRLRIIPLNKSMFTGIFAESLPLGLLHVRILQRQAKPVTVSIVNL